MGSHGSCDRTECQVKALRRPESGQAMVEYILVLAAVASGFIILLKGLDRIGLAKRLMKPLSTDFAKTYQYGHPQGADYPAPKNPRSRMYIEVRK